MTASPAPPFSPLARGPGSVFVLRSLRRPRARPPPRGSTRILVGAAAVFCVLPPVGPAGDADPVDGADGCATPVTHVLILRGVGRVADDGLVHGGALRSALGRRPGGSPRRTRRRHMSWRAIPALCPDWDVDDPLMRSAHLCRERNVRTARPVQHLGRRALPLLGPRLAAGRARDLCCRGEDIGARRPAADRRRSTPVGVLPSSVLPGSVPDGYRRARRASHNF